MPTPRESILQALLAALQTVPASILRGEVLPERVPAGGLLILRDGEPGEPEVTLSPLRYHYEHRAELEVVVQGKASADRDAAFDVLTSAIGTALAADRTLGGLCDWVEAEAPRPVDLPVEGAMPEIPRFAMYTGCVLDQLSLQMQRSGLLTAGVKLVAQGENAATSTAAGTPTGYALQRFGHFNGAIKRNGTAASLEFSWVISANVSLTITAHAVYLPRPRVEIQGPQGIQASFDWQAAYDSVTGEMCTIVLKNQVASY